MIVEQLSPPLADHTNPTDLLWRFMDADKFMAMLESSCLWFARTDTFEDPCEGLVPQPWQDDLNSRIGSKLPRPTPDSRMQTNFASCWYRGAVEPSHLWKSYGGGNCGVCIRTTTAKLVSSLRAASVPQLVKNEIVHFGAVRYLNFKTDHPGISAVPGDVIAHSKHIWAHFLKRHNFIHEQEVRAMIWHMKFDSCPHQLQPLGLPIPLDLATVLEEIVVSPYAMKSFIFGIANILKQLNLSIPVRQSDLLTV
jgi:hypothetical protein